MHLKENDSSRFYKIWLGILEYTNYKYKAAPQLKAIRSAKTVNPAELVPVKDILWQNYTVFMGSTGNDDKPYAVSGITDSLDEMFHSTHLPLLVEAVLIPFEGRIIYDSLLMSYNIHIGSNMRRGFNEEYRNLKAKKGIFTTL